MIISFNFSHNYVVGKTHPPLLNEVIIRISQIKPEIAAFEVLDDMRIPFVQHGTPTCRYLGIFADVTPNHLCRFSNAQF